jgi:TonB family protein
MKIVFLSFFIFWSVLLFAQNPNHKAYFLDATFAPTDLDHAKYLLAIEKENDSTYHHWYYHYTITQRTLFQYQSYKDENGTIENGYFVWYNNKGLMDSSGFVKNNLRHGKFHYYESFGNKLDSIVKTSIYENGELVVQIPTKETEINNDVYDEPYFTINWAEFLESNLKYPATSYEEKTHGEIYIDFTVTTKGKVVDVTLTKSVDYFLDCEAIRVIKLTSGKWVPGKINNIATKTYHQQKITFALSK